MYVRFIIDGNTYIRLVCDDVDDEYQLIMCSPGKMELWYKNKPICLLHKNSDSNSLWDVMLAAEDSLKAVLKRELEPLPGWPSVGYMLNEYYYHLRWPEGDPNNKIVLYAMWSPGLLPSTLLYNRNGEIILQIVPIFRWFVNQIPYKVFIRNYRSYFTCTISHETAQEWLNQVMKLKKIILDNYDRDKANMVEEIWSSKKSAEHK